MSQKAENRSVVDGAAVKGRTLSRGHEDTCFAVMEMLYFLTVMVAIGLYTFVKTHQTIYLKRLNFTVHKLYFSKTKQKLVMFWGGSGICASQTGRTFGREQCKAMKNNT